MNKATISIIILLQLLIAPLAFSAVYVNLTDLGGGMVELSFDGMEEPYGIRAFALDITVSGGVILLVDNFSPSYPVLPGPIMIFPDECGIVHLPSPIDSGSLGTSAVTVAMGSINPDAPTSGVLLTFMVSGGCDVRVRENALRGGIVFSDPSHETTIYLPDLYDVSTPTSGVYGGGNGSMAEPYLIFDADQLNEIGLNPGDWNKQFKLMADIDLTEYEQDEFNIIGNSQTKSFSGVFNGNGQTISNFTYTCQDANYVALFGCVNGTSAVVKNLCLSNPNVNVQTGSFSAALVGSLERGTISSCCSEGGSISGYRFVGSLVGWNKGGTIENCYSTSDVSGTCDVGGLVGKGYHTIDKSYSASIVGSGASISGGFTGYNEGDISSCFWDVERSGQADGVGDEGGGSVDLSGETTPMMKTESTFTSSGWDFKGESANGTEEIWTISNGVTYPKLVKKRITGDFAGANRVDLRDYAVLMAAWKSQSGDDHWNPLCDIAPISSPDGKVDGLDLAVFISNYLVEEP